MTFFYQAGHRLLKVNQKALSFGLVASATLFASIKWKPSEVQAQSVTADAKAVDNGIGTVSSSEESLFKLKKMGHYENRLRFFSHPLKVFQYFASVYEQDTKEYFMTPADFVRSIVPFTEAHLLNRANGMNDIQKKKLDEAYHKIQEFADSNGDGLISFQEYLFFLEILSIPETMFEMAFKIFDTDGNGSLDGAEFAQVVESHKTKVNMRMGLQEQPNYSKNGEYSGFMAKLFGPTGDKSVTFQQFYKSIKGLNDAILMCEYYSMPVDEKGRIDMKSFACSLLTYCPEGDSAHFAQRLESFPASINEKITFDQFKLFIEKIATNFNSIQVAMQLLDEVGHSGKGGVGKDNFVNAIKVATSLTLTKGQVDTIYYIFDRNQDGNLDAVEFSDAIKGRKQRSLDYSLHRGFAAKVMQLWRCATKEQ